VSNPFVAEIRIFPFNFAPTGWALCNGQLMAISQNTALFSLLGTTYGGDGKSNFALPNLQGNSAMHPGQGAGLSLHDLGETAGETTVTVLAGQIPLHTHTPGKAQAITGSNPDPTGRMLSHPFGGGNMYATPAGQTANLDQSALTTVGGNLPHNNLQPYLVFNFCIALQGVFPPRG